MALSLAKLEAAYWVHRLGSFQAAARQLHVTQPTISSRVRELEEHLGVQIFCRKGHKIFPTDKGVELLDYADQLIALTEEMQNRIRNRPAMSGVLRLGAADSFALTCLSCLLRRLEDSIPSIQVELHVDHSFNLSRRLNMQELDIAFLVDPQVDGHVKTESIRKISSIWIAGTKYQLPKGGLEPLDLQREQILTLPPPSTSYTIVKNWFKDGNVRPRKLSTCNSMNMIVSLAIENCGISVVPMCIVSQALRAGVLDRISVKTDLPSHGLYVAYQTRRFSSGLREIAEMGRQEVAQHKAFVDA